MASTGYRSIDDYIAAQPEASMAVLEQVRRAIRAAAPDAVEAISYQIAAFKLHGKVLIYFAGWKEHFSLYPAVGLEEPLAGKVAPYQVSKGTLRFALAEPVPVELIQDVVRFRAGKIGLHPVRR